MRPSGSRPADPKRPRKRAWSRGPAGPRQGEHGRPQRGAPPRALAEGEIVLYGWHTVKAALENPARRIRKLYATENAARRLSEDGLTLPIAPEIVRPDAIAQRLAPDAVHNGLLAEADPLPAPELEELASEGTVLVLDQITDPHN